MGATARKQESAVAPMDRAPVMSTAIAETARPLVGLFDGRAPQTPLTEEQEHAIVTLLAMTDGNTRAVQRLLDGRVSHAVIWNVKTRNMAAFIDGRERWKKLAMVSSQEIFDLATSVVHDKLPESSARDAAVVAGIYAEKSALFAGDAITIHHVHSLNPSQMAALAGDAARLRSIAAPTASDPGEVIEAEFEVIE